MNPVAYTVYEGRQVDAAGKEHHIRRTTCGCGEVLSLWHIGCCGFASSGYGKTSHTCKEQSMSPREAAVQLCNAAYWEDTSGRKTPKEQAALWQALIKAFNIERDEFGFWR